MNPQRTATKAVRDGAGTVVAGLIVAVVSIFHDLTVSQTVGIMAVGSVLNIGVIRLGRDLLYGSPSAE